MLTSWETTCAGGSVQYKLRRKLLSQNFVYSRTLINSLVRNSSIGQNDTVLEIGPGKGFITAQLLRVAEKVIAVELDSKLVSHLKRFLGGSRNLELYQADFLRFSLPDEPYKVFANIPFSIEGEIVRKLLDSSNPPNDSYLVVVKELAIRLSGVPHENQFSLKHKPWFDFSLQYHFRRSDFTPQPGVDSVLWRITKKEVSELPFEERQGWERFIEIGFGSGTPIKQNLRKMLTFEEINYLSGKLTFSIKTKPGYLSFSQWLQMYKVVKMIKQKSSNVVQPPQHKVL